jgi:DNA-binding NarL/FixJ family response regulator
MRLLLCDSHRLLAQALADALGGVGHSVGVCDDVAALPTELTRLRPDCCLLETTYADRLRVDALVAARAAAASTVLVVLTGRMDPPVWELFDRGVLDGVISKKAPLAAVEHALVRAHRGRREVTGFRREASAGGRPVAATLTAREQEVLHLLVAGLPTGSIAEGLDVSRNTVRTHVAHILHKLDAPDRAKAVHHAVDRGLVDPLEVSTHDSRG